MKKEKKAKPSPWKPGMTVQEMYEARPNLWIWTVLTLVIIAGLVAWSSSAFTGSAGTEMDGWAVAKSILNGIFHPSKELLFSLTKEGVLYLLVETLCIAFLGTLVGAVLAVPFAFLGATNIVPSPIAIFFSSLLLSTFI